MIRKIAALVVLMTAVILPLMYGCAYDPQGAQEQAKRTADGSEKKDQKNQSEGARKRDARSDVDVTVTPGAKPQDKKLPPAGASDKPGAVTLDPDLGPSAPEKKLADAPQKKSDGDKAGASKWPIPLMLPASFGYATIEGEDGSVITIPVYPGDGIHIKKASQEHSDERDKNLAQTTTEQKWKALRETPPQVWVIAGIGLLLSLIPLFIRGYRWLCPAIAVGVVAATVMFALTYSQGEIIAYGAVGVIALCAIAAILIVWLLLRSKTRMQGAIVDLVTGVELAKKNLTEAAAQTTDTATLAAINQARSTVKTSLGVEANDATKALVARVKTTGRV